MSNSKNALWKGPFEELPSLSALSRKWSAAIFHENHGCNSTGFTRYHGAEERDGILSSYNVKNI